MIVTDAFLREARVQQAALGAEDLEPVVISHPLSTLTANQIAARAVAAAAGVRQVLTSGAG